jgi:hypothetical protein
MFSGPLLDAAVQLHQVGRIPFQQLFQLGGLPLCFLFDRFTPFFEPVAD